MAKMKVFQDGPYESHWNLWDSTTKISTFEFGRSKLHALIVVRNSGLR